MSKTKYKKNNRIVWEVLTVICAILALKYANIWLPLFGSFIEYLIKL